MFIVRLAYRATVALIAMSMVGLTALALYRRVPKSPCNHFFSSSLSESERSGAGVYCAFLENLGTTNWC
eukprot:1208387-Ditylum_brightwellii.AAC.1